MGRRTYQTNYTFTASTKKIVFNDIGQLDLSRVSLITNVTRNVIIYNPNIVGFGGTVSSSTPNELTLVFDTASHSDTDVLLIAYENGNVNTRAFNSNLSKVSHINITNGGSGYTSAPTIAFVGNTSSVQPTAATVVIDGCVVGIKVTNSGVSTVAPTSVTITGGGGSGAAASAPVSGQFNRQLVDGEANAMFQVYGTFVGTTVFEVSIDGYNFFATNAINISTGAFVANTTTALNGEIEVSSYKYVQIRCSLYTSGRILTNLKLSNASGLVGFNTQLPTGSNTIGNIGGTVTANQGTANAAAWLANPLTPAVFTIADTGVRTATFNGATQTNNNAKGVIIHLIISAVSGTSPQLNMSIEESTNGGTTWFSSNIISSTIIAPGGITLKVYPSIPTVTTNPASANSVLARTWRIVYNISGTASPSFTIGSVNCQYVI